MKEEDCGLVISFGERRMKSASSFQFRGKLKARKLPLRLYNSGAIQTELPGLLTDPTAATTYGVSVGWTQGLLGGYSCCKWSPVHLGMASDPGH